MTKSIGLGCLLLLVSSAALGGMIYAYKDAKGQTVYSDKPPPANAQHVQQKIFSGNVIQSSGLPYEVTAAAKKNPVIMWGTNCGDVCDAGLALLRERGMPFKQEEPGSSKESLAKFKQLTGALNVPVLQVGSQLVRGFRAEDWNAALDAAGYPKSVPRALQAKTPAKPTASATVAASKPAASAAPAKGGKPAASKAR